uniref:Uncharacterized protein n=1 Tax=Pseudomonas viridiflava TaxID=33069 RepID=I6LCP0_PSEVI|nr:hypothetical protein [Pseudomonas viridiflava]
MQPVRLSCPSLPPSQEAGNELKTEAISGGKHYAQSSTVHAWRRRTRRTLTNRLTFSYISNHHRCFSDATSWLNAPTLSRRSVCPRMLNCCDSATSKK